MKHATPKAIRLEDYRPPSHLVEHVSLVFDLRDKGTRVRSRLRLRRNPAALSDDGDGLFLHGENLELQWLSLDGRRLPEDDYRREAGGLRLPSVPDAFELETEVVIAPETNTALEGLYRSGDMFCTQCEAEGFRKITYYLDRPDVMAVFDVRIEADRERFPVLLSNGNPVGSGELPGGRHFAEWQDPFPKPSYLFALVAGDLRHVEESFVTASGREVTLRIHVEPQNIDRCEHAMRSLVRAMHWDEERYGREYDLDVFNIVAVDDFNMGAMENKGLNIFNSKYVLARPDTATDADYQGIEGVVAHEYFHNWTGNRITCRDWFQLSLKEGLTVYRDQEFSADMGSRPVKRIDDVRLLRAHQFAEDASPMAHPVRPHSYIEINNFYTVTVYEKGAEVVRMQASLLGPERFRKAMDLYFERFDGQAVTTEDFVSCMEEASGRDLTQFRHWYDYAGTPELTVTDHYDAASQTYTLRIQQAVPDTPGQTNKPPFHIPFAMGLLDREGRDMAITLPDVESRDGTLMLELREREEIFVFPGITERPTPSFLRGFSAPVKLQYDWNEEQLLHLLAHDSDGFSRWDAGQTLFRVVLLRMTGQYRAGEPMSVPPALLQALRKTLFDDVAGHALVAELLTLPSIDYLGDFMPVIDVEALHAAREALRHGVAEVLREDLLMRYEQLRETGDYSIDAASMGRRRLKNTVLGYLSRLDDTQVFQLLLDQYGAGHNMTDVMVALALIADSERPEREQVLADFAQRWAQDALVMDKWFSVQATASRPGTLARVRELMAHPAFSITNPNRVRALIGAFVNANPVNFHAADGSGYDFLAEQVIRLDPINPQIAARLCRPLARWQRYDQGRQQKMRAALQRILENEASPDVYEVVAKSLEAAQ
ncbi:MAG: aminopeptidase N [Gammaproteobacteria bacterium]|nr:MAG: aminopeptidase N [Gammaproteobacteria bacterium]